MTEKIVLWFVSLEREGHYNAVKQCSIETQNDIIIIIDIVQW